jgi:SAM-dependent methyltransferase
VASAREHYDGLLAAHYSWMFGDFAAKVAEQQALLERLGIAPRGSGRAIDLGCGSGFQSLALARLGFRVRAIDFSERLLAELRERARGLPIDVVGGDIRDVVALGPEDAEVAVCMGDTLSHLEREADVERVFTGVRARLGAGGRFVVTFRDLGGDLRDLDRIIPLRATDDVIMACFLEYEAATVKVHDLVWVREPGGWTFRKSFYRKLRLAAGDVAARLEAVGFTVERREAHGGMVVLLGVAPDRPRPA